MTRQEYLAEAARYEMLAAESRRQVVSGASPEYLDGKAREMRTKAAANQLNRSTTMDEIDPILAQDAKLYAEATPEHLAIEAFVNLHQIVDALHKPTGICSRFKVAEHANVGPGWLMRDVNGLIPGIVADVDLTDLKAVD